MIRLKILLGTIATCFFGLAYYIFSNAFSLGSALFLKDFNSNDIDSISKSFLQEMITSYMDNIFFIAIVFLLTGLFILYKGFIQNVFKKINNQDQPKHRRY